MFVEFFCLLRQRGLKVSPNEWITLLKGLELGLHESSIAGFYHLCRTTLVKSEADLDRFDQTFLEFFEDVPFAGELPDIPEELMQWLNEPSQVVVQDPNRDLSQNETMEELVRKLEERLEEQETEHNGGVFWIATQGKSALGNGGWHPGGIRVGGESQNRTGMLAAGERKFRDFRKDRPLDLRQFQTAFRTLRQLAARPDDPERELSLDGTIRSTCDHGGLLHVEYQPPRKNDIKILLLMDSGGSMARHARLCATLFQAAAQSNFFREVQTYYFHNCIYEDLYQDPGLNDSGKVATEWVLSQYDSNYRAILVGDGMMNEGELWGERYDWATETRRGSGLSWLKRFLHQYPRLIWLNPEPNAGNLGYWSQTHLALAELFPMFPLSVEGLEQGMKRLMARR